MATDITELRLSVRIDEGTGPALVMLHGINSDGGDWRTVIDTIGPGYRFVAFDLLGFGRSPKPLDIDYSADEHALVLENTLQDIGVDDPFLLVGYSLGGDIALRYASTYPDRLRRLFLLDAPFYLPASELTGSDSGLKYVWELGSQWLWNRLASSKQKDSPLYKLATGAIQDPLKEAFHADDMTTHWEIMGKNLANTVNTATWVDDLPKLTMPVVHAIGVRDAIVKVGQAPALKRLKPDLEIRRIGGLAADHMVLWNMPERVAEEIMRDEIRELAVAWRGGSGEPLVLLHGLEDSSERWVPAAEVLARSNDVAVIDLLGFGDSPAPQSLHYTLADHVAAVLATVTQAVGVRPPRSLRGRHVRGHGRAGLRRHGAGPKRRRDRVLPGAARAGRLDRGPRGRRARRPRDLDPRAGAQARQGRASPFFRRRAGRGTPPPGRPHYRQRSARNGCGRAAGAGAAPGALRGAVGRHSDTRGVPRRCLRAARGL